MSHAVSAVAAVLFTAALAVRCADDPPKLASVLIYGLSTIALYTVSSTYHIGRWSGPRDRLLRRLDHGNIFLMIAGTTTPIAFNVLPPWERAAVLGMIWTMALTGLALTMLTVRLSRSTRVILYSGMGLANLIALPALLSTLPPAPVLLLVLGGLLYIVGAVFYARRRPNPIPGVFGHHELFHLFVVAAGAAFGSAIWFWVVPFPRT